MCTISSTVIPTVWILLPAMRDSARTTISRPNGVVVKQLPAEFQIQLPAEFLDTLPDMLRIQMDHLMYERVFEFGPVDIVIAAHRKCVTPPSAAKSPAKFSDPYRPAHRQTRNIFFDVSTRVGHRRGDRVGVPCAPGGRCLRVRALRVGDADCRHRRYNIE